MRSEGNQSAIVRWTKSPHEAGRALRLASAAGLDAAIDVVRCDAMDLGRAIVVDVYLNVWMPGDPLLVECLVGHPQRAMVVWHDDGEVRVAVDPELTHWMKDIEFVSEGGSGGLEPSLTRLLPSTAREILLTLLLDNTRATAVQWVELAQD